MRLRSHRWTAVLAAGATCTAGLYGTLQCSPVLPTFKATPGSALSDSTRWNTLDSASGTSVGSITTDEDLNALVTGQAVLLMCRGYGRSESKSARANFEAAARSWFGRHPTSSLKFFVLDDETPKSQAEAFTARIGVVHPSPFVMILDDFLVKEHKYLTADKNTPSTSGIFKFLEDFTSRRLKPALMGQPRPPKDRSDSCKVCASTRRRDACGML
jgi:hypothetical protein